MKKRYTITETVIMAALVLVAAAFWSGCERGQVGSPYVPNALPDTRVGGETPVPLESGFLVHFDWGGSDPDGEVVGFQWKLVPVGSDGISVPDTLTEDPDTGQLINPWHFTTTADSVFVISAAPQPAGDKLTLAYVFLVRSVDSDDGVDPTPAQICFTASTLLPTIVVDRPDGLHGYNDAQPLPPTVRFGWTGTVSVPFSLTLQSTVTSAGTTVRVVPLRAASWRNVGQSLSGPESTSVTVP